MKLITSELIREVRKAARLLVSKAEIEAAFNKLAFQVTARLAAQNPIIMTVMNGALFTSSELCLRLDFPLEMDYLHATRYEGKLHGYQLKWYKEPQLSLAGRTVLLVDDILDEGVTLAGVKAYCMAKGVMAAYTLVLLDKTEARLPEGLAKADFTGLEIPNEYVFGYGLDYHNYLRNVPGIYAVAREHMN